LIIIWHYEFNNAVFFVLVFPSRTIYITYTKFFTVKSHSKKVKIHPPLKKNENISLLKKELQFIFFILLEWDFTTRNLECSYNYLFFLDWIVSLFDKLFDFGSYSFTFLCSFVYPIDELSHSLSEDKTTNS